MATILDRRAFTSTSIRTGWLASVGSFVMLVAGFLGTSDNAVTD